MNKNAKRTLEEFKIDEDQIVYMPSHEGGFASNITQYFNVQVDGRELVTVLYCTHFPHNWTKETKEYYLFFGFDCQDDDYDEKLTTLKAIASRFEVDLVEDEAVHLHAKGSMPIERVVELNDSIVSLFPQTQNQ